MYGYTGKILRVDLTTGTTSSLDTAKYEQYGGGHGIGSAIFWELCKDKTVTAYDPRNVITVMTSPLSGTLTPSASSRTEVQGIGSQSYPIEWFTRSNFGGRFAAMLKYAGWDGIVIEGKAKDPVWLDIRDGEIKLREAASLWGLLTNETQEEIWRYVGRGSDVTDWVRASNARDSGQTTQRPAVVCIGPAGENLSRIGALVHDGGNSAGQGGFGGVFGSKNLKAISVIGTGSVTIADPKALMSARLWVQDNYRYDVNDPKWEPSLENQALLTMLAQGPGYGTITATVEPSRPHGCLGCPVSCRRRTQSGHSNESMCVEMAYYAAESPRQTLRATDLLQHYGVNAFDMLTNGYLRDLYKKGVLGPGKAIDSSLSFEKFGTYEFAEQLVRAVASRKDIGAALAEGFLRAAKTWGRLDEDLATGALPYPQWGYHEHYDPRSEIEWSYGSILGERDINEHDINWAAYWMPTIAVAYKLKPTISAEELARVMGEKLVPYNDPMMVNYSKDGIYSDAKVKMVAWHRHYSRFWKEGALYCDWAYPSFVNPEGPDNRGYTPDAEPKFWNAVTGQNLTFADGIELGRKVWNLDRSIWALQGRTRDMEVFSEYVYKVPTPDVFAVAGMLPMYENGKWEYGWTAGRVLDRDRFEDWKTRYYKFEGWDPSTGRPTRKALDGVGLGFVADELQRNNKLGTE